MSTDGLPAGGRPLGRAARATGRVGGGGVRDARDGRVRGDAHRADLVRSGRAA